jgi:hypothetical protein
VWDGVAEVRILRSTTQASEEIGVKSIALTGFVAWIVTVLAMGEAMPQRAWVLSPTEERLRGAYGAYSIVQLCNQDREGYAVTYINDVELQRARTASKAIEVAAIAEDPTINPDKAFAEADKYARSEFSRWRPEPFREMCRAALEQLLAMSPVSRTQMP